jgi:mRNA-degrading endonuclease RelE of RelBE toxin-antitoxin system
MTYNNSMVFIETAHFSQLVSKYLSDEDYRKMQLYLMEHPDAGDIIRGSGGVRKLRWSRQGMGKSGGVRTIYYWAKARDQIYLLYTVSQNVKILIKQL